MSNLSGGERPPVAHEAMAGDGSAIGTMTGTPQTPGAEFEQSHHAPDTDKKTGLMQRFRNFRGTKEILDITDDIENKVRYEAGDLDEAIQSKSRAAWERTAAFVNSEGARKVAKIAIPMVATGAMIKRWASHKQPSIMDEPKDLYNRFKKSVNNIDTIEFHNPIEIKRN